LSKAGLTVSVTISNGFIIYFLDGINLRIIANLAP
jgi:hypothetical protein